MLAPLGVLDASGLLIGGIESARKARGERYRFNAMMPIWKKTERQNLAHRQVLMTNQNFTFSEWRVVAMAPKLAVFRREPCAKKSSVLKRVDVTRIQFEIFCIS